MRAKIQRPFVFNNVCECNYCYIDLSLAMLWYTSSTLNSKKKVFISGRYPAVSIGKEKIHIHRLLMNWKENRKLKRSEHVHHIDGDILNANIENLELVDCKKHISRHLKGKKQNPEFARKRTDKTSMTRYGHHIHEEL